MGDAQYVPAVCSSVVWELTLYPTHYCCCRKEKGKEGKSAVGKHVALNIYTICTWICFVAFSLALSAVGASVHSHGDMLRLFRLFRVVFSSKFGCGRCRVKDAVRFTVPKPFS